MYAELQPDVLDRAQHDAAYIFSQAGVELRWVTHAQLEGGERAHVSLVVLPEKMIRKLPTSFGQFGFAVHDGRAYIFLDRLSAFAKEEMASVSQLLGPVMAHEIGHLLLGPDSHFTIGIMHSRWRKAEVKYALMGSLVFTPEQGRIMRRNVLKRMLNENLINQGDRRAAGQDACDVYSGRVRAICFGSGDANR
jgi:hypothetical protein